MRRWLVFAGLLGVVACGPAPGIPDSGTRDAGPLPFYGPIDAGTVPQLYFAIVGDTRPGVSNGTYPTPIIDKIYADIAAMNPQPQFVITTGDYMYTDDGSTAEAQLALYLDAGAQYPGPIFAAMGNHECTGFTSSNCTTTITQNYLSFLNHMVKPLGLSAPYYRVNVNATDGSWTAKILILACNAWDSVQQGWVQGELADPTTYTFVVRHEPPATTGPCVAQVDQLLTQYPYDILIVGHSHTYTTGGKQLLVGNGGAPIESNAVYGYGTVQQVDGGLLATEYQYDTALPAGPPVTF